MKYSILLLFFHFIVISCNDSNPTLPISKDKLVHILVDIHVAEAAMQEFSTAALKDSVGKVYYKKIFAIHKVTEADFNKSIIMIKKEPADLDELYKKAIKEIELREKTYQK